MAATASILACPLVPATANAGPDDCATSRVVQRQVFPHEFGKPVEVVASASGVPVGDCPYSAHVAISSAGVVLYRRTYDAKDVAVRPFRLSGVPLLDVATFDVGGSTEHRTHTLLVMRRGVFVGALPTFELEDQDGFFVGALGARERVGVVLWGPDWDEPVAHHAPRHYRIQEYQLAGMRLVRVKNYLSERRMMLGSDAAATVLGLPFKDAGPWRLTSDGLWEKQP